MTSRPSLRLGGAVGDAQGRLVEDQIAASHQLAHQPPVADVALDQLHAAAAQRIGQVRRPAAHHVVDGDDAAAAGGHQSVDDVRADEPGAAR